jgi:VIT1/CCC1 family predicted Fe2+/Mn2+ transporter
MFILFYILLFIFVLVCILAKKAKKPKTKEMLYIISLFFLVGLGIVFFGVLFNNYYDFIFNFVWKQF